MPVTVAGGVFGVAALEKETGFFVTFFCQVVKQGGISATGQFAGKGVDPTEQTLQIRFWICGAQSFNG